jgi:hypothetical protein
MTIDTEIAKAEVGNLISDPVLAKYAAEIRRLGKRVKEGVVAIGRYLDRAQKHAGRGAWLAWIEAEFGWSDQTAYRFIHLYQAQENSDFHNLWNSDLPLSGLYQLAAPKTPDAARAEIAERVEAGEKVSCAKVTEVIAKAKDNATKSADDAEIHHNDDEDPSIEQRRAEHAVMLKDADDPAAPESADSAVESAGCSDAELLLEVWNESTPEDQQFIRDLVLEEFFAQASGADLYDHIPAASLDRVCSAFLDKLTVDGMRTRMSAEFGRALRARLPAPKRKSDKPFKHALSLKANSARHERGNHSRY